jgi:nickel-dependent lactate racemase
MKFSRDVLLDSLPEGWSPRTALPAGETTPLGSETLPPEGSLSVPPGRVLIVVNDAQRATPTPWLLSRLDVDWSRSDLDVVVACGSHRPPGEDDLAAIFGPFLQRIRGRLILHDPADARLLAGTTARGTPVEVNPCLEERAVVLCLGSLEPHYFAGWTGGRKSIVPGLGSLETMRANHRLAMEGGQPGRPAACPAAIDLDDALALCVSALRRRFGTTFTAFNVVARGDDIYGVHWGPLRETLDVLGPCAEAVFGRCSQGRADIVVTAVSPPLDRDLYQALKAFENWKRAVADGGILVLAAPCPAGVGPPTFLQFLEAPPGLEELRSRTGDTYRLGDHKIANYLSFCRSGRSVCLVSGGPLEQVRAGLPVDRDWRSFLTRAQGHFGTKDVSLLLVDDGAETYPVDLPIDPFL